MGRREELLESWSVGLLLHERKPGASSSAERRAPAPLGRAQRNMTLQCRVKGPMIRDQGRKILPEVGVLKVKMNSAALFTILCGSHDFHHIHSRALV